MKAQITKCGVLILGLSAFLAMATPTKAAPKPPAPPPEGGVIYYFQGDNSTLWSMDTTGANKTLLLSAIQESAEPSNHLHGGLRWFLVTQPMADEYYPDGNGRRELFAMSEHGDLVQLADDPTLQTWTDDSSVGAAYPRWSRDDLGVSFFARRWGAEPETGAEAVVETGLYVVNLEADVADPALQSQVPARLPIDFPTYIEPYAPPPSLSGIWVYVSGFDWAPDGSAVAYGNGSDGTLCVADAATGATRSLTDCYVANRWSPDGATILFTAGMGGDLKAISPDGTNLRTIIPMTTRKGVTYTVPMDGFWSPTGANLIYRLLTYKSWPATRDVYRATSAGANSTNLTGDISSRAIPLGWRANA
jgi:hypothetical protein